MTGRRLQSPAETDAWLGRGQRVFVVVAVVAGFAGIAGLFVDAPQFFRSYLMGWLFCLGVALGSLSLLMLQYLTGGRWGIAVERIFEAASRTLPVVAILFVPVLLGMHSLYPWTQSELVAADPVLRHKQAYLNVPFFVVRAVAYFVIWAGLAFLISRHAARQTNPRSYWAVRRLSAIGLIVYVFTITFASVDWAQSLQPRWYSTMWGFLFVAQHGLATLAFTIGAAVLLSRDAAYSALFTRDRLHELGKLLLMFVMLWAYFAFSQFLIIWSGDLTEEIPWYLARMATSWGWIGVLLAVAHFAIPFLILLSRPAKRTPEVMIGVALLLLVMRLVDLFWIVQPDVFTRGLHVHWLDLVVPVSVAALWLASFVWQLRKRSLLPDDDPRLEGLLSHA